jgi:hypothetical protein
MLTFPLLIYGETPLLVIDGSDEPIVGATVYLISRDSTIVDAVFILCLFIDSCG